MPRQGQSGSEEFGFRTKYICPVAVAQRGGQIIGYGRGPGIDQHQHAFAVELALKSKDVGVRIGFEGSVA